jgi:hypothetical protein
MEISRKKRLKKGKMTKRIILSKMTKKRGVSTHQKCQTPRRLTSQKMKPWRETTQKQKLGRAKP